MRPSSIHVLARALRWTAVELQHDRALQLARLQGREEAQGDASRSKSIRPAAAEAVGKWEKCDSIFPKAGSARRLFQSTVKTTELAILAAKFGLPRIQCTMNSRE